MMRFVSIFIVSLVLTCVKCQLSCGNNQFACFDGKKCIDNNDVCNGYTKSKNSCEDGSDEDISVCKNWDCNKTGKNFFKCNDGQRCVRPWEVCDGFRECKDRSDEVEEFCNQWVCYDEYWKCRNNRRCVSEFYLCDGKDHCGDGSDEDNRPGGGCHFKRAKRLKGKIGSGGRSIGSRRNETIDFRTRPPSEEPVTNNPNEDSESLQLFKNLFKIRNLN